MEVMIQQSDMVVLLMEAFLVLAVLVVMLIME